MISTVDPVIKQLCLASEASSLLVLEEWINNLCEAFNIGEELYGNILISVTESVNNAIIHGNLNQIDKTTTIEYNISESELSFIIMDQGIGFDFNNVEDPTEPQNINQPNGRGIFLMTHLSDKVEYTNPGNKVEVTFNL